MPSSAAATAAPLESIPDLFEGFGSSPDAKRVSRDEAAALVVRATRAEHEAAELKAEVDCLRARADEASRAERTAVEERDVLLENISKLYVTARHEIARKDDELKRLRERCAMAKGRGVGHKAVGVAKGLTQQMPKRNACR